MRTKTLLLAAAALSAGVLASSAQVYSANVVGYVNKEIQAGGALLANPLNGTNNNLTTIIPTAPEGTIVFVFDRTTQDWDFNVSYQFTGGTWAPDAAFPPGVGFLIYAPETFTNTFVGEVDQASHTTTLYQEGQLLASIAPIGGPLGTVFTNMPAVTGDIIFSGIDPATSDYLNTDQYEAGAWIPNNPIAVADSVLYYRFGDQVNWTRQFTVN